MATVMACICGLWNYSRNTYKYWAYEVTSQNELLQTAGQGQRSYNEVDANEPATSFLDAGRLAFREAPQLTATFPCAERRWWSTSSSSPSTTKALSLMTHNIHHLYILITK